MRLGIYWIGGDNAFSGIPYWISRTLSERRDVDFIRIGGEPSYAPRAIDRIRRGLRRGITGRCYLWEKEERRCAYYSANIDKAIEHSGVDAALVFGSELVAFCESKVPLYCYADSIFGTRLNFYPEQWEVNIVPESIREGRRVHQMGLDRLAGLFVATKWSWERARQVFEYTFHEKKVIVAGIGAGLPKEIRALPRLPPDGNSARFVWLGSDWSRKGGEMALTIVAELRRRGWEATLDILGPVSPGPVPEWCACHGKIELRSESGATHWRSIFETALALLLPTRAETLPMSSLETFALGRPVIMPSVGGIPESIEDGRTGLLLDANDPASWVDRIDESLRSGSLRRMSEACRAAYEESFNWPVVCGRIVGRIQNDLEGVRS